MRVAAIAALALVGFIACGPRAEPERATHVDAPDLVLFGAHLVDRPETAIAIRGGKIVGVGGPELARGAKKTEDVAGAVVLPGLRDGHVHLVGFGEMLTGHTCDVTAATSEHDLAERVRAYVASRTLGPDEWVHCAGWNDARWGAGSGKLPSSTSALDEAVGGRPAVITRQDGHTAWVSKRALDLAKVTRDTVVRGGEVWKDERGEPTGILTDNALGLVHAVTQPRTEAELEEVIVRAMDECVRLGLVEVHDAAVFPRVAKVMRRLAEQGRMPLRVSAMIYLPQPRALEEWMNANAPITTPIGGRFVVRTVKVFADGALGGDSAHLMEPYADRPAWRGVSRTSKDELASIARTALRRGWQVAVHAIGDAAIHDVVTAFAEAGVTRDARFRVEHASLVPPEDFDRFASLGLIASLQPGAPQAIHRAKLGDDRAQRLWNIGPFLDRGVPVALGTDVPAGPTVYPLYPIGVALAQGIPRPRAVALSSEGVPFAMFAEKERGPLRPGFAADLTVFESDPFAARKQVKVRAIYVDGKKNGA